MLLKKPILAAWTDFPKKGGGYFMNTSVDLSVKLRDITFKTPFIVGSGPTVKNADQIKAAADNGWAGASIKLAIDPFPYLDFPPRYRWLKNQRLHIFTAEKRLTAAEALRVLEEGRKVRDDFVLIPTITYDGEDYEGWGKLAKRFQDAGARIIELNMCCPNMSFNLSSTGAATQKNTGASLGNDLENLPKVIRIITEAVEVPIIVKLCPDGNKISASSQAALRAGAAAVGHSSNRLGIPDVDIRRPMRSIYRLQDQITLGCLSGPWIRPLALRDTYQMRCALGPEPFIISSGGVSDLQSAVEQIMVGADAVWICTQTMIQGFDWMPKMLDDLTAYMREMGYTRIRDFRDILLKNITSAQGLTLHKGFAQVDQDRCTSCGLCRKIGHCTAIQGSGKPVIHREECLGCSTCVDVCPGQAISMHGEKED
jgi:dihydroorotate dehydrogenase/Pyruvate/2-oxoacid:ferredoxin oxidoreductase delta subunit